MTIHEIAVQLFSLSKGRINGEQFTKRELEHVLSAWTRDMSRNKIADAHVIEIELPDGNWLAMISRHGRKADDYGYYIPETREEEQKLFEKLTA